MLELVADRSNVDYLPLNTGQTSRINKFLGTNVAVYLPGELEALDGVSLGDGLCEGDPGGLRVLVGLLGCALLRVELPGSAAGLLGDTDPCLSHPSPSLKIHPHFPPSWAHLGHHSHPLHQKDCLLPPPVCRVCSAASLSL